MIPNVPVALLEEHLPHTNLNRVITQTLTIAIKSPGTACQHH